MPGILKGYRKTKGKYMAHSLLETSLQGLAGHSVASRRCWVTCSKETLFKEGPAPWTFA